MTRRSLVIIAVAVAGVIPLSAHAALSVPQQAAARLELPRLYAGAELFPLEDEGQAVVPVGDVTGDGRADLAVARPAARRGAGEIRVLAGPLRGLVPPSLNGTPGFTIVGPGARRRVKTKRATYIAAAEAGEEVVGLGDVNGDGRDDLGLTLPGVGPGPGAVMVVFGRSDGQRVDVARLGVDGFRIDPPGPAARDILVNVAVARTGDVDGDGLADLAVQGGGRTDVLLGARTGSPTLRLGRLGARGIAIRGQDTQDGGGFLAASIEAGDVDGDGRGDLFLDIPAHPNGEALEEPGPTVDVVAGRSGGSQIDLDQAVPLLRLRLPRLSGSSSGLGRTAVGDVDGDGIDDVAASLAPEHGFGSAWLVRGRREGGAVDVAKDPGVVSWRGPRRGEGFGASASAAGDVDGDGHPDLLVSASSAARGCATDVGAAWVLPGSTAPGRHVVGAPGTPALRIDGALPNDNADVGGAGDLDGDGRSDLVVDRNGPDPDEYPQPEQDSWILGGTAIGADRPTPIPHDCLRVTTSLRSRARLLATGRLRVSVRARAVGGPQAVTVSLGRLTPAPFSYGEAVTTQAQLRGPGAVSGTVTLRLTRKGRALLRRLPQRAVGIDVSQISGDFEFRSVTRRVLPGAHR